ncbi:hypothetical protein Zmor_012219 [Zophobas morio]|uniref:ubiquitinyl hydrolase 1 n=1 Tax=Zophobas morio TaxID=2755281 RepID=A0AA38HIU7_9CUCU|nr:hypothetical protein Zmor_012219 [Zophobas morio]
MGNTCYMNCVLQVKAFPSYYLCVILGYLQCLCNLPSFPVYFLNNAIVPRLNRSNPLGTGGQNCLIKFAPRFSGCEQHDAQEFLSFLLDGLHEDLNHPISCDRDSSDVSQGYSVAEDAQLAELSWSKHKARNNSIVVDFFQGQFRSTLQCQACRHCSSSFTPFMFLSLPVSFTRRTTLDDCLKEFTQREIVSGSNKWYCPKCEAHRDAWKQLVLWRLPPVLIVHLKRFKVDCNGNVSGKNEANVLFPLENLDLSLFSGDSMHSIKYSLSGVSMHRGTLVNGHYTSFCKSTVDGSWRYYDDTKVRTVTDAEIQTGDAYVLYYSAFTENLHRVAK